MHPIGLKAPEEWEAATMVRYADSGTRTPHPGPVSLDSPEVAVDGAFLPMVEGLTPMVL